MLILPGLLLLAENHLALYVPEGFAHGFQTLSDDSEVLYQMSEFYHPELASGDLETLSIREAFASSRRFRAASLTRTRCKRPH